MTVELLNEDNGEILSLEDYLAQLSDKERDIGRLDQAIADNKTESKAMKDAREKAVFELRMLARDIKTMRDARGSHRSRRGR